jgi:hypothetical protein
MTGHAVRAMTPGGVVPAISLAVRITATDGDLANATPDAQPPTMPFTRLRIVRAASLALVASTFVVARAYATTPDTAHNPLDAALAGSVASNAIVNPGSNSSVPGGPGGYAFGCSNAVSLPPTVQASATRDGRGYWLVGADGGVFTFGDAQFYGSTGDVVLNRPVVGMTSTPDGRGYWLVASDGGVFSFGDAQFYGSTGDIALNAPVVGMTSTPDGRGYWLVASDGGVFSFGDAQFYGSTGDIALNAPVVGMTATSDGKGYWLVAADGGVFSFGDARFFGSTGNLVLNRPVVGITSTPDGKGYWLVASDGGVFNFGDAHFYGSTGDMTLNAPVVGMSATLDGKGYWIVASDGGVFSFGDSQFFGSLVAEAQALAPPSQCDQLWVQAINQARQAEGIGPMSLPSNWNYLTPEEQMLVAVNLERSARQIAPVEGLTDVLGASAEQAAASAADPALSASYSGYAVGLGDYQASKYDEGSIWSGSSPDEGVLKGIWLWMYDDGPGGFNVGCPGGGGAGCWEHRDILLGQVTGTSSTTTLMGAGWATGAAGWGASEAAVFADFSGGQPPVSFGWSSEAQFLTG